MKIHISSKFITLLLVLLSYYSINGQVSSKWTQLSSFKASKNPCMDFYLVTYQNLFFSTYIADRNLHVIKGDLNTGKVTTEKILKLSKKKLANEKISRTNAWGYNYSYKLTFFAENFAMKQPAIAVDNKGSIFISYSTTQIDTVSKEEKHKTFVTSNQNGKWSKVLINERIINSKKLTPKSDLDEINSCLITDFTRYNIKFQVNNKFQYCLISDNWVKEPYDSINHTSVNPDLNILIGTITEKNIEKSDIDFMSISDSLTFFTLYTNSSSNYTYNNLYIGHINKSDITYDKVTDIIINCVSGKPKIAISKDYVFCIYQDGLKNKEVVWKVVQSKLKE